MLPKLQRLRESRMSNLVLIHLHARLIQLLMFADTTRRQDSALLITFARIFKACSSERSAMKFHSCWRNFTSSTKEMGRFSFFGPKFNSNTLEVKPSAAIPWLKPTEKPDFAHNYKRRR